VAFLELIGLAKSYGAKCVLRNVHLAMDQGEFVSIVGASGSGKTTLLSIAAGLQTSEAGRVLLAGQPLRGFPRRAAIVFQNYSLLPWYSALENVRLAVEAAHPEWTRAQKTEKAVQALCGVGLGQALEKRPPQLSGGMRQRVALARAFAVDPEILFLDEPFGALDALTRATLQRQLADLCRAATTAVTVLMITNSVDEAILLSDRVVALSRGPEAALAPPIPVPLSRPRDPQTLLHAEDAVRIRARVAEYLAGAGGITRSAANGATAPAATLALAAEGEG
jgi:nitrate/nitrite transport system ATP-binding protein